jgi:hypothetical protein
MKRDIRIEKIRDIRIGKTKILTPYEAQSIARVIKKRQIRALYKYLLATGMRFVEFPYIIENPEIYDVEGRVIHLKARKRWDIALPKKDRDIYLSYADIPDVNRFLGAWYTKRRKRMLYTNTSAEAMTRYIRYWVGSRGHDIRGYGTQSLRKSRYLWLAVTYPEDLKLIARSLDYYPFYNDEDAATIEGYIDNPPFTRGELNKIERILKGWKRADL